ncbi:MAG TPA: hypothetical protein VFN65_09435 [Solirubrobacteraceae bacterium]|nr:hypothetical protein [Solirubrobacteraceae bacterium]
MNAGVVVSCAQSRGAAVRQASTGIGSCTISAVKPRVRERGEHRAQRPAPEVNQEGGLTEAPLVLQVLGGEVIPLAREINVGGRMVGGEHEGSPGAQHPSQLPQWRDPILQVVHDQRTDRHVEARVRQERQRLAEIGDAELRAPQSTLRGDLDHRAADVEPEHVGAPFDHMLRQDP